MTPQSTPAPDTPQGQDGVSPNKDFAASPSTRVSPPEKVTGASPVGNEGDGEAASTPPAPAPGSVSQAAKDAALQISKYLLIGMHHCTSEGMAKTATFVQAAINSETIRAVSQHKEEYERNWKLKNDHIDQLEADLAAANGVNVRLRKVLELARDEMEANDLGVAELNAALTDTAALGGFVAVEKWKLDRLEATAKSWHEATLGKDAQAILDEWIKRGGFDDDPSLGKLQGIIQIKMNDLRHQNAALLELVAAWEALDSCQNDPARARFRSEIKTLKKKAGL